MNNTSEFLPSETNNKALPPLDSTWLVNADTYGLLALEGPDAVKFLQGQVTCDVLELAARTTRLGAQCTPKGRMLVSFRALQPDPERIILRMHNGLIEPTKASLGKYIVFAKAKLVDQTAHYRPIIISGPDARVLLEKYWDKVPSDIDAWSESDGHFLIKISENIFECWIAVAQADDRWRALATECASANSNAATLLAIRQGIGEVRPESRELFTPQALNFQLVNGVSFRKGCYTGQEIVARLHYRGTLKRHMYRFGFLITDEEDLPSPGTSVINSAGQNIGEIVLSAFAEDGRAEVLAVVVDDQLTDARLSGENGKILAPLPLPYAIPSEDKS